ncbi:MAG: hypothetical protein V4773_10885, partial [Verrucomicrobiota bacterium]
MKLRVLLPLLCLSSLQAQQPALPSPDSLKFTPEAIGRPPLSLRDITGSGTKAPVPLQFGEPSSSLLPPRAIIDRV